MVALFHLAPFQTDAAHVISTHEHLPAGAEFAGSLRRRSYWSEEGKDRHHLLGAIFTLLNEEDWRYSTDTGWNEWDIQIYGNFWWSVTLQTVTEYHGGPKCLTRAGLRNRFVPTTVIINFVALSLLVYRQLNVGHAEPWLIAIYFCFVFFLGFGRAVSSIAWRNWSIWLLIEPVFSAFFAAPSRRQRPRE